MDDVMKAIIYNKAIEDAVRVYDNGGGRFAMLSLRARFVTTIEHVGTTSTQNVEVVKHEND